MTTTTTMREAVQQVITALGSHDIMADDEGDVVTTQIESGVSADVEYSPSTGLYTVWVRAWDRTGGLGSETEIGSVRRARHAAALIHDIRREASYDGEDDES